MSNSLSDQLQQILIVVGTALKGVGASHRADIKRKIKNKENKLVEKEIEARKLDQIRRGTWHDGRLDCVAGNGIMSELGIGDELIGDYDGMALIRVEDRPEKEDAEELTRKQRTQEELEAVSAMPVVIIRNYGTKIGSRRDEFLTVLAQWAAMLSENQVDSLSIFPSLFTELQRPRLRMLLSLVITVKVQNYWQKVTSLSGLHRINI